MQSNSSRPLLRPPFLPCPPPPPSRSASHCCLSSPSAPASSLPSLPRLDFRRHPRRHLLHSHLLFPLPPFRRPPVSIRSPSVPSSPALSPPRVLLPTSARGPAAHRDPNAVALGVAAALEFYSWAESRCGFRHNELTCRDLSRVLARANRLPILWRFLRSNDPLVSTATVTEVIKVLGEEGLANEALAAFYRMKQLHCKPDVQSYNTVISALCRVGLLKKARFLLDQMELPGARCPPDTFTYTILISSYCKRSLQTGCRKAIRRRMWEASHMFRRMQFHGFVPDVVTYNCLIDGLCKTYRIERAHELLDDMLVKGCSPNRVTYNSFIRYYSVVNQVDKAIEMMRAMVSRKHGIPTSGSYTPIIHALCETGRVREAKDFLVEMVAGGSIPREFTYKLISDALNHAGEESLSEGLNARIVDGMRDRFKQVSLLKSVMGGKSMFLQDSLSKNVHSDCGQSE